MTPRQLMQRYPYQFPRDWTQWYAFPRGWYPAFASLCAQVDALLGADKRGFHWKQLKEKFGTGRYYFAMKNLQEEYVDVCTPDSLITFVTSGTGTEDVTLKIRSLVRSAQDATSSMCMYCGAHGQLDTSDRYVVTLCTAHMGERNPVWSRLYLDLDEEPSKA